MNREGGEKRKWYERERTTDSETVETVEAAELQEAPPDTAEKRAERAAAAGEDLKAEAEKQQAQEEPVFGEIPEKVEVEGATVTVTRFRPKDGVRPDSIPLVFMGMFASEASSYGELLPNLTATGREVIFLNPLPERAPREEEKAAIHALPLDRFVNQPKMSNTVLSKAGIVRDVLEKLGIDEYFTHGHSLGGKVAAGVTALAPEKSKGGAYSNISGVAGKKYHILELVAQIRNPLRGMSREKELGRLPEGVIDDATKRMLAHPRMYLKEFFAAAKYDTLPVLRAIKGLPNHPPIHMLWGMTDIGYPGKRMHKRVMARDQSEKQPDMTRDFYDAADTVAYLSHPAVGGKGVPEEFEDQLSARVPHERVDEEGKLSETGKRPRFKGEHTGDLMHSAIVNFPELAGALNQYFDELERKLKEDA